MKKLLGAAVLFAAAVSAHATVIGFTAAYAPANWTQTIAGNGSISASPTTVSITSPSNLALGGFTEFTISVPEASVIFFDWAYTTNDDPEFELFGYLLNGLFARLSDPFGSQQQAGSASVAVSTGDVFGFAAWALDNQGTSATTRISAFAVPEPGSLGLALVSLVLLAQALRRQRWG